MSDPGVGPTRLTTRPIRYADGRIHPDDLALVTRLITACDVAVIGEPDSDASDVDAMFAIPTMDRESSFLALDGEDAVGVVWIEDDTTARDTFIDVFAPPGPRAREVCNIGFPRGLAAARRHRETATGPGPWTVRTGCWTTDVDYAAAITAHGFTPSRCFHRMRIASSSPMVPDVAPPLPDGVAIVASDDDATRRRIWAVDNDSFSEHYNYVPREYDEWWAHNSAGSTRDPAGWWLLTVDGEDAAICLLDESRAELGDGYVGVLGVRAAFRGRGLGQLLLRRAFVHYRDLGRAGTQLGVDAENTTGAVRVYEAVGMTATRTIQGYSLPLD